MLEKAFAKFCGSYSDIDNKTALWALEAIAGRPETVAQIYIKEADKVREHASLTPFISIVCTAVGAALCLSPRGSHLTVSAMNNTCLLSAVYVVLWHAAVITMH